MTATPANEMRVPSSLVLVSVSAPITPARNAVITGVVAISSAESPAGMSWSAIDQRSW